MKAGINSLSLLVILGLMSSGLVAAELLVPSQYLTIQAAMDAAVDDDRVIVAKGTYFENVVFGDKNLTLASTDPNDPNVVADTVIDADGSGTAISFPDSEDANHVFILAGFTITGGDNTRGGGVHCHNGNITVKNCVVAGNRSQHGAGIYNDLANLTCVNCTFEQNTAESGNGGGVYVGQCESTLINCTFIQNSATFEGGGVTTEDEKATVINCTFRQNTAAYGGGMHNSHYGATVTNCTFTSNSAGNGGGICIKELRIDDMTQRITNCTFSSNTAEDYGGAVSVRFQGNLIITNCILRDNIAFEGPQISCELDANVAVSYSCVQGGILDIYAPSATVLWPPGNIDVDPCFADAASGDCHLRSTAGRWDPNQQGWVIDSASSLCIDAGNPGCPPANEPPPNGNRVNMGAYGGSAEASKTPSGWSLLPDLTNDGIVDMEDVGVQVEDWLISLSKQPGDLDRNGIVNTLDFALLAQDYLAETSWYAP